MSHNHSAKDEIWLVGPLRKGKQSESKENKIIILMLQILKTEISTLMQKEPLHILGDT